MSFDSHSELHPYLLALTQMTQWHADEHQLPLELRFTVHGGTVDTVHTALTGAAGKSAPTDYTQAVTVAVLDVAQSQNFSGSFSVRINTSPGGQAIVKQTPLAAAPEEPAPQQPQQVISADGLQLRAALLERGHTSGYSLEEITAEERERGFSFSPELKFYRALVRDGVIRQMEGVDVLASSLKADFGASSLETAPWKAPATHDGSVQAVLNHRLWIEIAHSSSHLYAVDLAPGPAGVAGQIIARRVGEASVPVQVATSLAQFVTGEALTAQEQATPQEPSCSESPFDQTIACVTRVEPLALPALLGWSEAPTTSRYREALQELTGLAPSDANPQEQPPVTEAPEPTPQPGISPVEETAHENTSSLFSQQTASAQTQAEPLDAESQDFDSDIAYAPVSPEQKTIATTIGTLAFGTKEQREEYRATDTNSIPTLDTRGKKLSLTSAAPGEVGAVQHENKQAESPLRSALRKFFTGS